MLQHGMNMNNNQDVQKKTLSIGRTIEEEIEFVKQMILESREDGLENIANYIWVPELERLELERLR